MEWGLSPTSRGIWWWTCCTAVLSFYSTPNLCFCFGWFGIVFVVQLHLPKWSALFGTDFYHWNRGILDPRLLLSLELYQLSLEVWVSRSLQAPTEQRKLLHDILNAALVGLLPGKKRKEKKQIQITDDSQNSVTVRRPISTELVMRPVCRSVFLNEVFCCSVFLVIWLNAEFWEQKRSFIYIFISI